MSWFDWGDKPITSYDAFSSVAGAVASNPGASDILAEIDSTKLHRGLFGDPGPATAARSTALHRTFVVTVKAGASSNGNFMIEAAPSTVLGSTNVRRREIFFSPPNQTAQYTDHWTLQNGDRLRVVVNSTFTGNTFVSITAIPLT